MSLILYYLYIWICREIISCMFYKSLFEHIITNKWKWLLLLKSAQSWDSTRYISDICSSVNKESSLTYVNSICVLGIAGTSGYLKPEFSDTMKLVFRNKRSWRKPMSKYRCSVCVCVCVLVCMCVCVCVCVCNATLWLINPFFLSVRLDYLD